MEPARTLVILSLAAGLAACKHAPTAEAEAHAGAEVMAAAVKVHVQAVPVTEQKVPKLLRLTGKLAPTSAPSSPPTPPGAW